MAAGGLVAVTGQAVPTLAPEQPIPEVAVHAEAVEPVEEEAAAAAPRQRRFRLFRR